ncbi:hypothetical protein CWIS_10620 [Cellulomonas sp. A375-1]|uniref:hypothetical protein n=1 Tax=Cellulomonas sp. A375-1 TaxID=1672219 RepID=UPI0006527BCC|nr:hypothetical protein [Cellulomonas sp. A375-1]KMM45466.1 hypothetical protein CWIS_10620 [Cellulomonas sp. A375-1]
MSRPVEGWSARQADEPQCVVQTRAGAAVLLDALARAVSSAGFRVRSVDGGFDAARGISGGYLLSEVVQLPLMTALARVELQVRLATDVAPGDDARALVTCVAGAHELGASKRVARALTQASAVLERSGSDTLVTDWSAAWQRGTDQAV